MKVKISLQNVQKFSEVLLLFAFAETKLMWWLGKANDTKKIYLILVYSKESHMRTLSSRQYKSNKNTTTMTPLAQFRYPILSGNDCLIGRKTFNTMQSDYDYVGTSYVSNCLEDTISLLDFLSNVAFLTVIPISFNHLLS